MLLAALGHILPLDKKGLLQNAVFRPNRKICALKKLEGTADLTVSSNFFFGLIFQNSILQQALSVSVGGRVGYLSFLTAPRAEAITSGARASRARALGMTMSWLNRSDSCQTKSLDRQEPRKVITTARME